jgi:hypothetical protein
MYNYDALILSTNYEAKIDHSRSIQLPHGLKHHPDADVPSRVISLFKVRPGTSRSRTFVATFLGYKEKDRTLTAHLRELLKQGILEEL